MKTTDQTSASTQPSSDKDSPLGFYLLMGSLIAGLVLVVLLSFLM